MSEFVSFGAWALAGVVLFIATTFLVSSREAWIALAVIWTAIGTALFASAYGVGHHWSVVSLIGKVAATAVAILSIVLAVIVGMRVARTSTHERRWRIAGGLVGGLVGIPLSQIVGLLAACSFTGACL
jgi:hypothetical protein